MAQTSVETIQEKMYSEKEVELIANEMANWAIDNIGNPNAKSGEKFDKVLSKYKKEMNIAQTSDELTYRDARFIRIREVGLLRMFFNDNHDYCIIVDKDDKVLFEISADCGQNEAYLDDKTEY